MMVYNSENNLHADSYMEVKQEKCLYCDWGKNRERNYFKDHSEERITHCVKCKGKGVNYRLIKS
jgi:hypothetical protein